MFNTEFVPAENLGVKNAKWDKQDGLFVPRKCYNSYFYKVEDPLTNTLDKIILHGEEIIKYLDGGSALHLNLEEAPCKEGFIKLIHTTAAAGCNYFCFNIKITVCNDCEHIDKQTRYNCTKCNSENVDHATRVIGYLKRVSSFSSDRQKEHHLRFYHQKNKQKTLITP
jgi:ribonucleoside-triphosphate reductase